jgi:Xaa-Pro aminopeptidase
MSELHAARRERLRERCSAAGLDAAMVTRPANIRWLTGRSPDTADGAALLLTRGLALLAGTPTAREAPHWPGTGEVRGAGEAAGDPDGLREVEVPLGSDPAVVAAERAAASGTGVLGVEEHALTVSRHREAARFIAPGVLADLDRAVERLRVVKDDEELGCQRIAAEIADQALGELLESILVGRTERHLAMELERRMVDHGADCSAFPVRVGTGDHSGVPGHLAGDRRVEEGDFLTVSLGACYRGYRTAATRTFVIGGPPEEWQKELHALVFAAQRAARESLSPGRSCQDVDLAGRQVLRDGGRDGDAVRPTGYGVGLEIAEDPRLGPGDMSRLVACVPVTVGQGVHLPGRGGVRIEDTLVVRPDEEGGPELLTITTKELLAL